MAFNVRLGHHHLELEAGRISQLISPGYGMDEAGDIHIIPAKNLYLGSPAVRPSGGITYSQGYTFRLVKLWNNTGDGEATWERHIPIFWNEFEIAQNVYSWSSLESWINAVNAPCHLDLIIYMNDAIDLTPSHHKMSIAIQNIYGQWGEMPPYASETWQNHYLDAITALADRYKNDSRVVSFWLALGVDQETAPVWSEWGPDASTKLDMYAYYDFLDRMTAETVNIWAPKQVYIQAATAPGAIWGENGRWKIKEILLETGVGYKMNGWLIDQEDSIGLGENAGLAKWDMAKWTQRFSLEPPDHGTGKDYREMYWRLLRAAHHKADFCAVQSSWDIDHLKTALSQMPTTPYWIVFRDKEYPEQWWGNFGVSGEPGDWGTVTCTSEGSRVFTNTLDLDRWKFITNDSLVLSGLPNGNYQIEIISPSGSSFVERTVTDGTVTLPAGTYYRIDCHLQNQPPPAEPSREPISVIGPFWRVTEEGGYAVALTAGATMQKGTVVCVLQSGSGDLTVFPCPTTGNENSLPVGIIADDTQSGDIAWVVVSGVAYVKPEPGVRALRGYVLVTSAINSGTVNQAPSVGGIDRGRVVGRWLEDGVNNGGLARAILHLN